MPAHMTLNVVMPYTGEEESWLTRQVSLVDEAFKSIPIRKSCLMLEILRKRLKTTLFLTSPLLLNKIKANNNI